VDCRVPILSSEGGIVHLKRQRANPRTGTRAPDKERGICRNLYESKDLFFFIIITLSDGEWLSLTPSSSTWFTCSKGSHTGGYISNLLSDAIQADEEGEFYKSGQRCHVRSTLVQEAEGRVSSN